MNQNYWPVLFHKEILMNYVTVLVKPDTNIPGEDEIK